VSWMHCRKCHRDWDVRPTNDRVEALLARASRAETRAVKDRFVLMAETVRSTL